MVDLCKATLAHIELLNPILSEQGVDTFFTDKSFLIGQYADILNPDLIYWHLFSAQINDRYKKNIGSTITRMIPILSNILFSQEDISIIKYALHFQLSLGMGLALIPTDDTEFLENNSDSDNLVLVKDKIYISCPQFYEEEDFSLIQKRKTENINDLFVHFKSLIASTSDSIKLKYNQSTFSCRNISNLKEKYGDFLYFIQNGKCAITGELLNSTEWDVDHIYPRSFGGNNSLINLRAVTRRSNLDKRDKIIGSTSCLSNDEFKKYKLYSASHQILSNQKLTDHPIGPRAVDFTLP